MAQMVADLAGCDLVEATRIFNFFNGDIANAVEFLLPTTNVSGDKYIPKKPTIDTGMDADQADRCARGRDLQDKVNSIFSVAASQVKSPNPDPVVEESSSSEPVQSVEIATLSTEQ